MLVNPKYTLDPSSPEAKRPSETAPPEQGKKPMPRDVNCINFRGLIVFLKKHYGDEGVQKVIGEIVDNERYLVADKYNPSKLVPLKEENITDPAYWVSNELSHKLMANVGALITQPDPLFYAGRGAVKETLSKGVFFVAKILGPGPILKKAQKFNERFNRTKKLTLVEMRDGFATLKAEYYPGFKASKDICDWHRGIITGVLEFGGLKKVDVTELNCRAQGDDYCLFKVTWKKERFHSSILKGLVRWALHWAASDLVAEYEESVKDRDILIERLTESEERYRSVFENTATPTVIVEKDLTITMANTEFERLSGYGKGELSQNKSLTEFMDRDVIEILLRSSGEIAEETVEFSKSEVRFKGADGREKAVLVKVGSMQKDERLIFSFVDISPRKRMEQALRASEEKHRTILQSIEEGYFEVDLKGNFTFVNESLCKIMGVTRNKALSMDYKDFTSPKTAERIFSAFNKVFKTGRPVKSMDFPFVTRDGKEVVLALSVTLMRDSKGEPVGFRGIVRDETERMRAREERRRLRARLEQAKRMEAIGTLAGGVAHDLNNILSGIVSYPELLLMQIEPDHPMYKPIMTIKQSGEKAAAMVQDLLTLARRGVPVTEVVNLNSIIKDYLRSPEFQKLKSFHPAVEVETDLAPDLFNLKGSPVHLGKTIMNLVSNAAEAMPDGGVITITTENVYLETRQNGLNLREGEYVVLKVRDTGVGMSEEEKERIFEPFFTKKVMGRSGTGLGMAVVWGSVQDHKGHIEIDTAKGKGTTFTLYFPATREKLNAAQDKVISIEKYMGKGEAILVVDDVEQQREIASEMLRILNYKVSTVASGEEAVEFIKRSPPDGVVLDMIMPPGMDGLDTYRKILEIRPGQKAIIVSGFAESERVREALRLGAGSYIRKPYSLEKLGMALRSELDS